MDMTTDLRRAQPQDMSDGGWAARLELAACYRLFDHLGWTEMIFNHLTLRVPGEQAYPILPLAVPARGDSVATLGAMTAVRLFVERAQQHKPSFELNEREAPAVAELVGGGS